MSLEELEKHCTEVMDPVDLSTVMAVRLNSTPALCTVDVSILELDGDPNMKQISLEELKEQQSTDEVVGPVYQCVANKQKPGKEVWKHWNPKSKVMLHQYRNWAIEDGLVGM